MTITHQWLGLSGLEFVVDIPLGPALFRRLGYAAEQIRCQLIADGAVSSYRSLGVYWQQPPSEPVRMVEQVHEVLTVCLAMPEKELSQPAKLHEIPTAYRGPDLSAVAQHCGLSVDEVKTRHAESDLVVAAVGFMPHFAYLWGMDSTLATPRRSTPRRRVPLGAIGIADGQTGVYPCESPGGWQLIGNVDAADCQRICPQLNIGDVVRFIDIEAGS